MLVDLAKLSRMLACLPLVLGLALATANGSALAQEAPSVEQIFEALKPKSLPRNFDTSTPPPSASVPNPKSQFPDIERFRDKAASSFNAKDREDLGKFKQHDFDIEINFEYGSASIPRSAMRAARNLGEALTRAGLKGSTFLIEGHTDASGGVDFNQRLSERRAEAVKRFLVAEYNVPATNLVAVGYGKSRLKNPSDPFAAVNRRVRVVNMSANVANE
jgi:outer membrane protein OmpA-like peptidoglycan-associated protein